MKVSSVIRLNKLTTIERRLITRRIGTLTRERLQRLDEKLIAALGIAKDSIYAQERDRLAQILHQQGVEALLSILQSV